MTRTDARGNLPFNGGAFGTLESMDVLKDYGVFIPKKVMDTLTVNEAKFKEELDGVVVEVISEQDFVLPRFPDLETSQGSSQLGVNVGTVDSIAAPAPRSLAPVDEVPVSGLSRGAPTKDQELEAADLEGTGAFRAIDATSSSPVAED